MWFTKKTESCLLCSPEGCNKNRYLEWLYGQEKPNDIIYKNLEDVLQVAARL